MDRVYIKLWNMNEQLTWSHDNNWSHVIKNMLHDFLNILFYMIKFFSQSLIHSNKEAQ